MCFMLILNLIITRYYCTSFFTFKICLASWCIFNPCRRDKKLRIRFRSVCVCALVIHISCEYFHVYIPEICEHCHYKKLYVKF